MRDLSIRTYFEDDGLFAIASCVENAETLSIKADRYEITMKGTRAAAEAIKKRIHKVRYCAAIYLKRMKMYNSLLKAKQSPNLFF